MFLPVSRPPCGRGTQRATRFRELERAQNAFELGCCRPATLKFGASCPIPALARDSEHVLPSSSDCALSNAHNHCLLSGKGLALARDRLTLARACGPTRP